MSLPTHEDITALTAAVEKLARLMASSPPQAGVTAITVEQAAERLGASRSRVFELLQAGKIKRAKKIGRRVLVTLESIDLLTSEPLVKPRAPKQPKGKQSGPEIKAAILKLRKTL